MTSIDVRVGDRVTVLPGKACSAHTRAVLTTRFTIEVTSVRPDVDGAVEVTGVELTSRVPGAPVRRPGPCSSLPARTLSPSGSATPCGIRTPAKPRW